MAHNRERQTMYRFKNGYGASVIYDGYGSSALLAELAVTLDNELVYDTPVTNDVLGYLTDDQLVKALNKVRKLPRR